jgi:uncharacterized protein YcfJ
METSEVTTRFGSVTPTRVQIKLARGGTEEIALRHITGVRDEIEQHRAVGTVVGAFGVVAVIAGAAQSDLTLAVFGVVAIGLAVIMSLPRPRVTLHLADGRTRVQRGRIGTVDEAQQFVAAVRAHLFARDHDLAPHL